jgi:hypothetical protein
MTPLIGTNLSSLSYIAMSQEGNPLLRSHFQSTDNKTTKMS